MATTPNLSAHNIERAVLGAIIGNRQYYDSVSSILNEQCFDEPQHATIYRAIVSIVNGGNHPELPAVYKKISETDKTIEPEYLASIAGASALDLPYYVNILDAYRKKRAAYLLGLDLAARAQKDEQDIEELCAEATQKLNDEMSVGNVEDVTADKVMQELLAEVKRNATTGVVSAGSKTGFKAIDAKGGLKYSTLVVVAGESSHGKSSLALCFALNALIYGAKVAFYSLEMPNRELCSRIVSMKCSVSSSDILFSQLTPVEVNQVETQVNAMQTIGKNLHFDDRAESSIDMILSSIRNKKRKFNIDGVVVDYLQILNVNMKSQNKEQAMADVARKLKNIAKELNIWVIALSQLNRDKDNPVPSIARLRDSGQIAEAADEVYLIYRPEQSGRKLYPEPFQNVDVKGTALLDRCKGRNVGIGQYIVGFDAPHTLFYDLDKIPEAKFAPVEECEF